MPLFLETFWDGNGFEVLHKHLEKENDFVSNVANFIHQKAVLDADYAKGLQKIAKNFTSAGKDEYGTMKEVWEIFREELDNQAKLMSSLANDLDNQIAKTLAQFRDEQAKTRKATEKKVSAAEKAMSSARSNQQKLAKSLVSQEKTLEMSYEAFERTGDPKAEKNLKKAQKDAEVLAADYRVATKKAHFEKVRWEDAIIQMSLEFEQLEKDRINTTKDYISKFVEAHIQLIPQLQESQEKVRQSLSKVDPVEDITLFVEAKQTGAARPEELLQRSYAADSRNPMNADRRKNSLNALLNDIEQDIESETKGIAGVENLLKVYSEQPSYTNDAGMITSQRQLAHMREYLGILQGHLQSIADMLSSTGGSRSAYTPPAAISASSFAPSSPRAAPAPAAAPAPSGNPKCVGLYDFEASNEGELAFREGDEMEVLDSSDPDWVRVLLNGVEGYVPSNYVQIQ